MSIFAMYPKLIIKLSENNLKWCWLVEVELDEPEVAGVQVSVGVFVEDLKRLVEVGVLHENIAVLLFFRWLVLPHDLAKLFEADRAIAYGKQIKTPLEPYASKKSRHSMQRRFRNSKSRCYCICGNVKKLSSSLVRCFLQANIDYLLINF